VKERPILFSGPMVRALLDDSKTQTRRVVRKQFGPDAIPAEVPATSPEGWQVSGHSGRWWDDVGGCDADAVNCPFGVPGDRLWVRETWAIECLGRIGTSKGYDCSYELEYRADGATREFDCPPGTDDSAYLRAYDRMRGDWWPSIHMPRWASRITLEVTGVRVERLQDISETDSAAEGVESLRNEGEYWKHYLESTASCDALICLSARESFRTLWDSLASPGADWQASPWVWVVEFKRAA
jgi:hypothetical protein